MLPNGSLPTRQQHFIGTHCIGRLASSFADTAVLGVVGMCSMDRSKPAAVKAALRTAAALRRSFFVCAANAACFLHMSLSVAASAPSIHIDPFERAQYETYPPTVFAPTGRLHMVDSVGMAACNKDDATAGLVVALRCGGVGKEEDRDSNKEFIVVVGTSPRSPLAIQASALLATTSTDDDRKEDDDSEEGEETNNEEQNEPSFRSNLLVNSSDRPIPSTMSILSPTMLVATGGTPTDAAVLLDRIRTMASDMHNSNFGGTGFTYQSTPKGGRRPKSGMFGVDGPILARNIADMVQASTQSTRNRALAASAMIVDVAEDGGAPKIWRVDPSGQFWSCDAATVGRGAAVAEAYLMKEIARRMTSSTDMEGGRGGDDFDEEEIDNDVLEETMASLSNNDAKKFLRTLSMDEAIALARDCVLKVYEGELKMHQDENRSSDADEENHKPAKSGYGFRSTIGMGGAVLRPSVHTAKVIKF